MDAARLPFPPVPEELRDSLSRVSLMALSPSLHYRVRHWDELDEAERAITKADCERMRGLAGERMRAWT